MAWLVASLISGLTSPTIFVPSFLIGWYVRRWWQVVLGALIVLVLSDAEILLIELPGAGPDWSSEPVALVGPLVWCAGGFLSHHWYHRIAAARVVGPIRALPVLAGMVAGAVVVAALALAVGLYYLRTGELPFHTIQFGEAADADAETIFFQYLFPGLLFGQLVGGLIGRVLGRRRSPALA